jgi:hypothetical protein
VVADSDKGEGKGEDGNSAKNPDNESVEGEATPCRVGCESQCSQVCHTADHTDMFVKSGGRFLRARQARFGVENSSEKEAEARAAKECMSHCKPACMANCLGGILDTSSLPLNRPAAPEDASLSEMHASLAEALQKNNIAPEDAEREGVVVDAAGGDAAESR